MDTSIHGGATVAVPGPVLRRKNSLQASSTGQHTADSLHRKLGTGPQGPTHRQPHAWQAHASGTPPHLLGHSACTPSWMPFITAALWRLLWARKSQGRDVGMSS